MLQFEKNLQFRFCYENTTRISSQVVVVPRKIGSVTTSLNISERHIYVPQRMKITHYICANMCTNMPFKIYTENKYMRALSLAIASISISIAILAMGQKLGLYCFPA